MTVGLVQIVSVLKIEKTLQHVIICLLVCYHTNKLFTSQLPILP